MRAPAPTLYNLALLAFVSLAIAARQKYDVETTNGKITGHLAPGVSNTIEFLGVPYARPPLGQLRFAEPLPPKGKAAYIASDWV
jgi:cholinesterase